MSITLLVEEKKWRGCRGLAARIRRTVAVTLRISGRKTSTLTVLLADDSTLRSLNAGFRGRDKATNVLSFPSGQTNYLGDIAIAYGVAAKEARDQGKSLADHCLHLVVHGVLHLLGYDHERQKDARVMETLETAILANFGIADPYEEKAE